jgi:hypothetical protein
MHALACVSDPEDVATVGLIEGHRDAILKEYL